MLKFLAERTVVEVEFVTGGTYSRIVRRGGHTGWVKVSNTPENVLKVEFTHARPARIAGPHAAHV